MENTKTTASLLDVKKYFEENSSSKFTSEWRLLSDEDKAEIKDLVWAEINA